MAERLSAPMREGLDALVAVDDDQPHSPLNRIKASSSNPSVGGMKRLLARLELIDRLRRGPGRKLLVAGNHDNAHVRRLRRAFDEVAACAHLRGEPHLLFTHVPLDDFPAGCVNVHGHVHWKTSVDEHRIKRVRRADRVPADPRGGCEKAGLPPGPGAVGRERHDRPLHRLGEGLAGCWKSRRAGRRAVTGTPGTAERGHATADPRGRPTLQPDERLWLENYLERLKKVPGGLLRRLVVYGSKAGGDAGLAAAQSDLKVLRSEIDLLKDGRLKLPGIAARPAFDAVFFSTMAWCLIREPPKR